MDGRELTAGSRKGWKTMEVIVDKNECDRLRDYIEDTYHFERSIDPVSSDWLHPDRPFKKYRLKEFWSEKQEAIVNGIMCGVIHDDMIAMDWSSALYGHPWKKEIIVVGEKMIRAFDEKMNELGIEVIE